MSTATTMISKATTSQEVTLIRKMVRMLEKQLKSTKRPDARRRLQEKLKKQTQRLNELTMAKSKIFEDGNEDEEAEEEGDLDTTCSTLNSASQSSRNTNLSCCDEASNDHVREWSEATPPASPKTANMPFNVFQSSIDEQGNRVLKLGYVKPL